MPAMTVIQAETTPYLDAYRSLPRADEPRWLVARREAALARFGELGFPTRRLEPWRFTDLRPLQRSVFPPVHEGGTAPAGLLDAYRLAGPTY
ncbi:MAG TPA: hypothetical protein VET85_12600, partial [Stellaceae bacterium]|nr:hypothetical protein [Stellaceae bacterium]